jgi:hypothetical protein
MKDAPENLDFIVLCGAVDAGRISGQWVCRVVFLRLRSRSTFDAQSCVSCGRRMRTLRCARGGFFRAEGGAFCAAGPGLEDSFPSVIGRIPNTATQRNHRDADRGGSPICMQQPASCPETHL